MSYWSDHLFDVIFIDHMIIFRSTMKLLLYGLYQLNLLLLGQFLLYYWGKLWCYILLVQLFFLFLNIFFAFWFVEQFPRILLISNRHRFEWLFVFEAIRNYFLLIKDVYVIFMPYKYIWNWWWFHYDIWNRGSLYYNIGSRSSLHYDIGSRRSPHYNIQRMRLHYNIRRLR